MLLKQEHPTVICYSYAPPGCVISEFGQDEMEKHVMSVVSGDDIVSRISFQSLHRLRERIFHELQACQHAKYKILIRGIYQLFFKYPWQDDGLSGVRIDSSATLESALLAQEISYGGVQSLESSGSEPGGSILTRSSSQSHKLQLYVPGRIVYLSTAEGNLVKETWIDPK
uniref:Uncharacterized protein n=1 Tax=Caenorhabditis japonica TaxID=281687 RepID=A0A8R1DGG7_CAEJA